MHPKTCIYTSCLVVYTVLFVCLFVYRCSSESAEKILSGMCTGKPVGAFLVSVVLLEVPFYHPMYAAWFLFCIAVSCANLWLMCTKTTRGLMRGNNHIGECSMTLLFWTMVLTALQVSEPYFYIISSQLPQWQSSECIQGAQLPVAGRQASWAVQLGFVARCLFGACAIMVSALNGKY